MLDLLKRVMPDNEEIAKEINVEVMLATAQTVKISEVEHKLMILHNLLVIFSHIEKMESDENKLKYVSSVINMMKGF